MWFLVYADLISNHSVPLPIIVIEKELEKDPRQYRVDLADIPPQPSGGS